MPETPPFSTAHHRAHTRPDAAKSFVGSGARLGDLGGQSYVGYSNQGRTIGADGAWQQSNGRKAQIESQSYRPNGDMVIQFAEIVVNASDGMMASAQRVRR